MSEIYLFDSTVSRVDDVSSILLLDSATKSDNSFCTELNRVVELREMLDRFYLELGQPVGDIFCVLDRMSSLSDCKEFWDLRQQVMLWVRCSQPVDGEVLKLIVTGEGLAASFLIDRDIEGVGKSRQRVIKNYQIMVNCALTGRDATAAIAGAVPKSSTGAYVKCYAGYSSRLDVWEAFNFYVADSGSISLIPGSSRRLFRSSIASYFSSYSDDVLRERILKDTVNRVLSSKDNPEEFVMKRLSYCRSHSLDINDLRIIGYALGQRRGIENEESG